MINDQLVYWKIPILFHSTKKNPSLVQKYIRHVLFSEWKSSTEQEKNVSLSQSLLIGWDFPQGLGDIMRVAVQDWGNKHEMSKRNGIIQSNTFAWINCSFTVIGSSWSGFLMRNCLYLSDLENLCHKNFQSISIEKRKKKRKHNSLKHIKFLHYWPLGYFIRSRACWMQQLLPNCVRTVIPQWLKQV